MQVIIIEDEDKKELIKKTLVSLDFINEILEDDQLVDADVIIINSLLIKDTDFLKEIQGKFIILLNADNDCSLEYYKQGVSAIIQDERDTFTLKNILIKFEYEITRKNEIMLCLFNDLHLKKNGEVINFFWRTNKIKELFIYLLQNKNRVVSNLELTNLLWPELTGEKALKQLYTSIYNVRNTIEKHEIEIGIVKLSNGYSLSAPNLKTDVDIMLAGFDEIKEINKDNVEKFLKLIKIYEGGYLESEEFEWTFNERSRLQAIWLINVLRLVEFYKSIDSKLDMILTYLDMQKYMPYYEGSYVELIKLWNDLGNKNAANTQMEKLEKIRS